ncbi:1981_t:CDS:1, partial [Acaulospora morrowiae]
MSDFGLQFVDQQLVDFLAIYCDNPVICTFLEAYSSTVHNYVFSPSQSVDFAE